MSAHLAGNDSPVIVRLPFIALFVLSTVLNVPGDGGTIWERAGLWAAAVLNAAPVNLGIIPLSWVLPDGPLIAALLGAVSCRSKRCRRKAAPHGGGGSRRVCARGWRFPQQMAAPTIAGAFLFLSTEPTSSPLAVASASLRGGLVA